MASEAVRQQAYFLLHKHRSNAPKIWHTVPIIGDHTLEQMSGNMALKIVEMMIELRP